MNATQLLDRAGFAAMGRHPAVAKGLQMAPSAVTAILVAVLAWQLAGFFWSLFPGAEEQDVVLTHSANTAVNDTAGPTSQVSVAPIVEAHLFGEAAPEPEVDPVQQQEAVDAPETNLPLELKGTLASDDPANALAIIADGREENVFRIDDMIRRGVTLHSVQPQQVILSRSGQLEALKLPVPEETAATRPQVSRSTPQVASRQRSNMSQVITNNAPALQEIISPRPYYVGGQQRGYRLYPSRDRQKFAALGLRPGDIVTEINGMPLTNAQQAAQVFSQLSSAASVTVMLERNGKPQSLTLDVNQIENATQADE